MNEHKPLAIRAVLLREIMKDPIFRDRFLQAKEWNDMVALVREFAEKKGLKFMEIYV